MIHVKAGIIGGVIALAVSFMIGSAVTAATCATDTVTPLSTFQVGSTDNNFIGQNLQVNQDSMFGKADWIYAGKFEVPSTYEDGAVDIGFSVSNLASGGAGGGDWTVDADTFDIYTLHDSRGYCGHLV